MLTSAPTAHGAGITLYGDFYDLSSAHETIHKIADQSFLEERLREYMLGLAYDLRKAFEGQREKRKFGVGKLDKVSYGGVAVLWPYFLTQIGMIRHFAAYTVTDHKDQSCLFLLEDCAVTSLLAMDAKVGKTCAEWLLRFPMFPNDYLLSFVTESARKFVFDSPTKKRFASLPETLRQIDWRSPEYARYEQSVTKMAKTQKCSPHALVDTREWPGFQW